jgi:hypothetical protein
VKLRATLSFFVKELIIVTQKPQRLHKSPQRLYSFKITETIKSNFGGFSIILTSPNFRVKE